MTSRLEIWARTERTLLREEIDHFKAGGKVLSPSSDDITVMKLTQLELRLEGVVVALKEIEDANEAKSK